MTAPSPAVVALGLADPPETWAALGFTLGTGDVALGGVALQLGRSGRGITHWTLSGISPTDAIDGLATRVTGVAGHRQAPAHPNTAVGLDHVVVVTADFDRTAAAFARASMPLRRVREVAAGAGRPATRQGFRRLGPVILELVESPEAGGGPARFWGLVVVVADLDGLAARLGERLGTIRPAVQPGRRIATVRAAAGLSAAVAFMDPEP